MRATIVRTLAAFLLATTTANAAPLNDGLRAQIDAAFKSENAPTVPGCALGVFRNGAAAYARGYGMADLEHGASITTRSLFDVGSISKQFSAAAIALLVQDGKLSYGDDVRKFIPELPSYGAPLTLNELMWHTSGLRDYTDLLTLEGYGIEQRTTDDEALAAIVRQRHLEFPSGSRYEYSNTNYFLLSVIVKRVTGKTLAQFVTEHIFKPLGMRTIYRTSYSMLEPQRAMGYAPDGPHSFRNSMSNWEQTGDGGVQLSIQDALKWDENFYRPRVGGPRMIRDLQTPGHLANGKRLSYARGLFVGSFRGLPEIYHGGAWIGYRAAFDRFPKIHTSVVVLCNSDAEDAEAHAQAVEAVVLRPYLTPEKTSRRLLPQRSSIAPRELTGAYFDASGGDVYHIVPAGSGISLETSGSTYPLQAAGGTTFLLGSLPLVFSLNRDGNATMRLGSGEDAVTMQRFTPWKPAAADLAGATGSYYSSELDVAWHLRSDGGRLFMEASRNLPDGAAGELKPQMRDTFTSGGGFTIRLTRNASREITGFALSAGRGLRSLGFTRAR